MWNPAKPEKKETAGSDDDYRTTTWENIEALTGSDLNPNKEIDREVKR